MTSLAAYSDFTFEISALNASAYRLRVTSPSGEAHAQLRLEEILGETKKVFSGAAGIPASVEDAAALGRRLFAALFADEIGNRFHESLGRVSGQRGQALRLRLQMDLAEERIVEIHSVPWELLCRPATDQFLALGRRTSVVRSLDLPLPRPEPSPWRLPLRVLLVAPEPKGLEPLAVERELAAIRGSWLRRRRPRVEVLRGATLDRVCQECAEREIHVLHFIGHGLLDEVSGRGALVFEDGAGGPKLIEGRTLAQQLADLPTLRLVFLNACWSGRSTGAHPFAGVATALVGAGVPAVLAMQAPIADEAAVTFSRRVYHRLATGEPLDAAVTEGRLALARTRPETAEWAVPVLFLRSNGGAVSVRPAASVRQKLFRAAAILAVLTLLVWSIARLPLPRDPRKTVAAPSQPSVVLEAPQKDPDHEEASSAAETTRTAVPALKPPPTDERIPQPVTAAHGETVYLAAGGLYVTVDFLVREGFAYVRIATADSVPGSEVQHHVARAPKSFTASTSEGDVIVDLLSIDWVARRVRLKARTAEPER